MVRMAVFQAWSQVLLAVAQCSMKITTMIFMDKCALFLGGQLKETPDTDSGTSVESLLIAFVWTCHYFYLWCA